ncbi:hypothetical protein [Paracoccus sp. NSM]|uniref:hypothetical protein n=1 Tax=Paracoccus sp. NSM TaxID=3457784 RepID=UPI0040363F17
MIGRLLDCEDEVNRLRDLLTLLAMASGDLPKEEGRAMSQGIATARAVAEDVAGMLAAIRADATAGAES